MWYNIFQIIYVISNFSIEDRTNFTTNYIISDKVPNLVFLGGVQCLTHDNMCFTIHVFWRLIGHWTHLRSTSASIVFNPVLKEPLISAFASGSSNRSCWRMSLRLTDGFIFHHKSLNYCPISFQTVFLDFIQWWKCKRLIFQEIIHEILDFLFRCKSFI